jgi:Ca2+/Na+ antiporter
MFTTTDALILTGCFAMAALISLLIFFNGTHSEADRSVLMTLIALSVKFLISLIIALLFFVVFKNRGTGSVILFFILYLAFTIFVFLTFVNALKKKSA